MFNYKMCLSTDHHSSMHIRVWWETRNDQNKWLHIVPHVSREIRRKFDLPSRNAWKLKNCSFFWPIKWLIRFSLFRFLFYFISFFLVVDEAAAAVDAIAKLVFSSFSPPTHTTGDRPRSFHEIFQCTSYWFFVFFSFSNQFRL